MPRTPPTPPLIPHVPAGPDGASGNATATGVALPAAPSAAPSAPGSALSPSPRARVQRQRHWPGRPGRDLINLRLDTARARPSQPPEGRCGNHSRCAPTSVDSFRRIWRPSDLETRETRGTSDHADTQGADGAAESAVASVGAIPAAPSAALPGPALRQLPSASELTGSARSAAKTATAWRDRSRCRTASMPCQDARFGWSTVVQARAGASISTASCRLGPGPGPGLGGQPDGIRDELPPPRAGER